MASRLETTQPISGLFSGFSCQHFRMILFSSSLRLSGILGRVFSFTNLSRTSARLRFLYLKLLATSSYSIMAKEYTSAGLPGLVIVFCLALPNS